MFGKSFKSKFAPSKPREDPSIVLQPPPAPMESVPFVAKHPEDMHTRRILIGSLARTNDRQRLFWDSVSASTDVPQMISPGDLERGDVLFFSREDSALSQMIRFWTQSPFNHTAIMARQNVIVETYPNKGILRYNIHTYLKQLVEEHQDYKQRPVGIWVVRSQNIPANFELSLAQVQLHDYDSEAVIANLVHSGNQDGPDHTLPLPWRSDLVLPVDHVRTVKPWSARESYTCADLIARLLNLDAHETH
jgi:hypothetical protein